VAPGGYYLIEHMHTGCIPAPYEGEAPGMDGASVEPARCLLDGVDRRHAGLYRGQAAALPRVDAAHVHEKIAFMQKPDAID
jgi:hypothetical protein